MTELSINISRYLEHEVDIERIRQEIEELYAVKTEFLTDAKEVIPEEEINKLRKNAEDNRKKANILEARIQNLIDEKLKIEKSIKYFIPISDRWIKVNTTNGFFLIKKILGDTTLQIDKYNDKEERINR
jgi:hypothetical protein